MVPVNALRLREYRACERGLAQPGRKAARNIMRGIGGLQPLMVNGHPVHATSVSALRSTSELTATATGSRRRRDSEADGAP